MAKYPSLETDRKEKGTSSLGEVAHRGGMKREIEQDLTGYHLFENVPRKATTSVL